MRLCISSLALLAVIGLSTIAEASYAGPPETGAWIGLTFSRVAPTANLVVNVPTTFVLRAERDVASLQVELMSAGRADAGSWEARVISLPLTDELEAPIFPESSRVRPLWLKTARVQQDKGFETILRCAVPRRALVNWVLMLSPKSPDAQPVRLRLRSNLVDQVERIRWLMKLRSQFNPEEEPERVRELVRYLTDQEVLHWASLPTRKIFLLGWRKMTLEQLAGIFGPATISRRAVPKSLPNGLNLLMNWVRPVKDPASVFLSEVVPPSMLKLRRPLEEASGRADAAAQGLSDTVVGLDQWSPSYVTEINDASGERLLQVRIHPDARSLALSLEAPVPHDGGDPYVVSIECSDPAMQAGNQARPLFNGALTIDPKDPNQRGLAVYKTTIGLKLRPHELTWLLRIRAIKRNEMGALSKQWSSVPLSTVLRIFTDASPINAREKELMAWRDRIDPLVDLDAVREMIVTLSDKEVAHYTAFPTREAFLKHWMRTKSRDLIDDQGRLVTRMDTHALTSKGRPLPNGRYLHHNGSGIPLD